MAVISNVNLALSRNKENHLTELYDGVTYGEDNSNI